MKKAIKKGRLTGSLCILAICLSAFLLLLSCDQNPNQSGCEEIAVETDQLSQTTQDWWAYEREATYRVNTSQVKVSMRDGAQLACSLSRPANNFGMAARGKFPGLVVEFTPYAAMQMFFKNEGAFFTRRGYNTLVCTMRGTGQSDGAWDHAMNKKDIEDAADLVEWLGTQSFSDGNVGQFGESYGGYSSYGVAIESLKTDAKKYLKAVAPLQSPGSLYYDVIFPGGIKATEGGTIDNWPAVAGFLTSGAVKAQEEYDIGRPHIYFDDFWKAGALVENADKIEVPVLAVGGWNDVFFRSGTLSMIEKNLDNTWAIYVPFTHIYPVSLTDDQEVAAQLPSGVLLAWFDKHLKGMNTPVPDTPTFVSFEGPFGPNIDMGNGYQEVDWKNDVLDNAAARMTYQLGSNGTLAPDAQDGTVTFNEPAEPTNAKGCVKFTTAPLDTDRVLLGHSTLNLRATLTGANDANFYAELIDVAPDGKETVVNDGFLKASHRFGHEQAQVQDIPEGQAIDYTIDIRADHYRFFEGHSLRLRISGASKNTLVPVEDDVTITIDTSASTLEIPGFNK